MTQKMGVHSLDKQVQNQKSLYCNQDMQLLPFEAPFSSKRLSFLGQNTKFIAKSMTLPMVTRPVVHEQKGLPSNP
jgi:hypothetical protein